MSRLVAIHRIVYEKSDDRREVTNDREPVMLNQAERCAGEEPRASNTIFMCRVDNTTNFPPVNFYLYYYG